MNFLKTLLPFLGGKNTKNKTSKRIQKKYGALDVLTLGSAVRDITLYTSDGYIFPHHVDRRAQTVFAFPYGGKISVDEGFFTLGGGAANSAVVMSKLGLRVGIYTRLGNDFIGEEIVRDLSKHQVDTAYLQKYAGEHSPVSFVIASTMKKDHVAFAYRGSAAHLNISREELKKISTKWYYLTALTGEKKVWLKNIRNIFAVAQEKKIKVAWNPGSVQIKAGIKTLAPFLRKTYMLAVNAGEAADLVAGISAQHAKMINKKKGKIFFAYAGKVLGNFGIPIVIITNSAQGAYAWYQNTLVYQPATKTKATDTTGAGDGFNASVATGQVRLGTTPQSIQCSLLLGTINTDSLIRIPGAQEGLLSWKEMQSKLPKRYQSMFHE